MGELIDLKRYREKAMEINTFRSWQKRFGENFDLHTRPGDLSDKTLFCLVGPGEKSARAFYELILGALTMGKVCDFEGLDKSQQMRVIDVHLFLADQIRFELMHRLQWLSSYPCQDYSLVEMVLKYEIVKTAIRGVLPIVSKSHPEYTTYCALSDLDKETFVRTLIPYAIEQFKTLLD
jgi:hypothetical protein